MDAVRDLPEGNETTSLLPVMVWIHGGAFTSGSGDTTWYGPGYLLDKEILLVTFNYRLGALGFLGLSHPEVSLNNGLKDQRAALRWIQQNIERFGGDPAQITIFGESAGGTSVEYQLISPSTSGLFQRAISQSGSVLSPWAYVDTATAQTRAQQLTQLLGYTPEDNNDIYNFLMEASAENITIQQSSVITERWASDDLAFVPTVEGDSESGGEIFLSATPLEMIKAGKFIRLPYITDNISSDTLDQLNNKFERFLPYDLNLTIGTNKSQQVAALVRETYFGNETASMATVENYVNFLTDSLILEGVHRTVNFRLRYNSPPIFVYQFSYQGRLGLTNFFHYNFTFPGAGHGDDISYLFTSSSNIELQSNSTELTTIDRMVTLWTNFAKARDLGEGLDLTWEPVGESKQTYLDINTDLSVQNLLKLHPERRAVWDFLFSEVDKLVMGWLEEGTNPTVRAGKAPIDRSQELVE
uniref:Carboxylic ester hydrolase n=1 Tax=Timema tahoe TaxID=61484 RepID=A0A7R9NUF1_9NEOP|nr:unnamed protein product [Timema tahoe]